jgi:hypothetical protein
VKGVNNEALLQAQGSVDDFLKTLQDEAGKLKAHLAELAFNASDVGNANELKKHVRSAYDAEYELTGDTQATSDLLVALGLKEEDFADELHVFSNDFEWVIARDMDDVRALFSENPGWSQPDEDDWENWDQDPDDQTQTIWCDSEGKPTEPHGEGSERVTLTNAEWCEKLGRGYFCTTEY